MNQAVEIAPPTLMQRHRRSLVTGASLAALLGLGAFGGYWWQWGRFLEETDDAYVRADWAAVSPRIAGYVAQVLVEDNQPVKAGDVLVRIDDRDFVQRLNGALAQLQQAQTAATVRPLEYQARVDEAQANVALARNALKDTEIRAPFDGVVGQRKVRRQQYVIPGLPLLAVVPVTQAYVIANYKETQLQHMAPGQAVEIAVDSFSGQHWRGEVESISPGSGAVFALLPPDNATGNFTKIVQRFAVKIRLVPENGTERILPGMSVIATVDTRREGRAHGG